MQHSPKSPGASGIAAILTVILFAVLISGCNSTAAEEPAEAAPDQGFPVTLTHAFGSITIEHKPQRIVTLGEDLDTLAALGITPVAYAPDAPGYTDDVPYLKDRIDLSGAEVLDGAALGEFKIEQIAAAQPDLILASNFYGMPKLYDELSKIAPTLAYEKGWGETTWQDLSRTIGRAVGDEAGAVQAVAETEQYLTDLKADLPALEGKTIAAAHYTPRDFASNPFGVDGQIPRARDVNPALLRAKPKGSPENIVSREQMDTVLNADFLILSFDTAALRAELVGDPIYQRLTAVKNKTVLINEPGDALPKFAGNNPTPLNIPWLLEQQRPTLAMLR